MQRISRFNMIKADPQPESLSQLRERDLELKPGSPSYLSGEGVGG